MIPAAGGQPFGATTFRPLPESSEDVSGAIHDVHRSLVRLAVGLYMVAMVASTAMIGIHDSPTMAIIATALIGGAITVIGVAMLEQVLKRIDRLGSLNLELSDLYDRARLDSLRDPLTGLGNHRAFQEELERAAAMTARHGHSTALLLIDLDDLKRVNDATGHAAGDAVLQEAARVMIANLRRSDRAFRIGGDEFAILSPHSTAEMGLALGRRLLAAALDTDRGPERPAISFTVGVSALPDPSPDRVLLYRHADAALYWGKRHGRTDVRVYDPTLQGTAGDERPNAELATAIDVVIAERRLTALYQPVFDLTDGTCRGFEGLIRPTSSAGFHGATALFEAAEVVSRTVELDTAAIREIAAGARGLDPSHYLTVNLSPRSIEAEAFNPHELLEIMAREGIEPGRIVVELTEREGVEDMDRLVRNLQTIRRTGARIAADDVGAGNAGLRLLSQINFDIIKIDLSLVQSGAFLRPSRSVLRAIIDLANGIGATTVAEGIETPFQLESLRELGIQIGQGYLLGMPRPRPVAGQIDVDAMLRDANDATNLTRLLQAT